MLILSNKGSDKWLSSLDYENEWHNNVKKKIILETWSQSIDVLIVCRSEITTNALFSDSAKGILGILDSLYCM